MNHLKNKSMTDLKTFLIMLVKADKEFTRSKITPQNGTPEEHNVYTDGVTIVFNIDESYKEIQKF